MTDSPGRSVFRRYSAKLARALNGWLQAIDVSCVIPLKEEAVAFHAVMNSAARLYKVQYFTDCRSTPEFGVLDFDFKVLGVGLLVFTGIVTF